MVSGDLLPPSPPATARQDQAGQASADRRPRIAPEMEERIRKALARRVWMDDEQTPPASEPAPPQNPLSQLLIELSRVFAAVPQTSEDERNGYIMALVEMARFVREAARSTQDTGLWEAQLRLSELAYALRDLDNGQVAPALRRTKRKAGSAPDSSVKWMKRVLVLAVQYALHQNVFWSWPSNTRCTSLA
jgi:hypothetical protein